MYKNLINTRKSKNLSINDMGRIISKSPANYFKKENGSVVFTVKEAILISQFLKKDIEFLFKE